MRWVCVIPLAAFLDKILIQNCGITLGKKRLLIRLDRLSGKERQR